MQEQPNHVRSLFLLFNFQHQLTQQNRQTGLEGLTNFHGIGAITGEDVSYLQEMGGVTRKGP